MSSDICAKFLANPRVNPRTGRSITATGKVYKKLVKECESKFYLESPRKMVPFAPGETRELQYNPKIWKRVFPLVKREAARRKLRLTAEGEYSIAKPGIAAALIKFIREHINFKPLNKVKVIESNAGLGGFTFPMTSHVGHVLAVEANPLHAEILKNNAGVLGVSPAKLSIEVKDALDVIFKTKADVVIMDPPWGGRESYEEKSLMIGLNNVRIWKIILDILFEAKTARAVILYCIFNLDMTEIEAECAPFVAAGQLQLVRKNIPGSRRGNFFMLFMKR